MSFLQFEKQEKKINKNYFFAGTFLVIIINFLVYYFFSEQDVIYSTYNWENVLDFKNLFICFYSAFRHFNVQHLLLNCLCFLIAGGYVERKRGSLELIVLVVLFTFFGEGMTDANHYSGTSRGFSGVNYAFYAYIIVDFIFSFKEIKKNKKEMIISVSILILIYIACCFCGGTDTISFKIYPYDLIHNLGHYTGFLVGLILSTLIKVCKIKR